MTSSVLTKVARAIERGSLPKDVAVRSLGTAVEVSVPRSMDQAHTLDMSERLLRWAQRQFPGGQLTDRRWSHSATRYRSRALTYWDVIVYRSGPIRASIYAPHEHTSFMAAVTAASLTPGTLPVPVWTCVGCRQTIKITEARRLGLALPRGVNA